MDLHGLAKINRTLVQSTQTLRTDRVHAVNEKDNGEVFNKENGIAFYKFNQ